MAGWEVYFPASHSSLNKSSVNFNSLKSAECFPHLWGKGVGSEHPVHSQWEMGKKVLASTFFGSHGLEGHNEGMQSSRE